MIQPFDAENVRKHMPKSTRFVPPEPRKPLLFRCKTIHFGSKTGQTFVDHKDSPTKAAWKKRHRVRGTLGDLETASGLANNVLWNKTTISASIKDINSRQNKYKLVVKKNRASSK